MVFDAKRKAENVFEMLKLQAADEGDDSVFCDPKYKIKALKRIKDILQEVYHNEDVDLNKLKHSLFIGLRDEAIGVGNVSVFNDRNYRNAALEVIGGGIIGEALTDVYNQKWIY